MSIPLQAWHPCLNVDLPVSRRSQVASRHVLPQDRPLVVMHHANKEAERQSPRAQTWHSHGSLRQCDHHGTHVLTTHKTEIAMSATSIWKCSPSSVNISSSTPHSSASMASLCWGVHNTNISTLLN